LGAKKNGVMINKVTLLGNVGKDPETMRFDNGGMIVRFPLATSDNYKDKEGNKVEVTDWHNIVCKRSGLSEVIEKYVKKGSKLFLSGKIKTRKYTDKEGSERYVTEVVIDEMKMLDSKGSEPSTTQSVSEPPQGDDLPF
jgi:single-strand DNA-binding protein